VFHHDPVLLPQGTPGVDDVLVRDQDALYPGPAGDPETDLADPPGTQGIGGNAGDGHINRFALGQRGVQRGNRLRFDAHHMGPPLNGCGNAAHQPAAPYGNQDGIDVGQFIQQLKADATGTRHDLRLVVRVAIDSAFFLRELHGGGVGLGVLGTALDYCGPNGVQLVDLVRRSRFGDEHGGGNAELRCRKCVRQAGVSTGSHHDADSGIQFTVLPGGEQPVEGTAGLERACVLHVLALEPQVVRLLVPAFSKGRVPHPARCPGVCCFYFFACDHCGCTFRQLSSYGSAVPHRLDPCLTLSSAPP